MLHGERDIRPHRGAIPRCSRLAAASEEAVLGCTEMHRRLGPSILSLRGTILEALICRCFDAARS